MKPFVRNLAVIIGINEYENKKLDNLQTAKDDAKRLASILAETHAYDPIIQMTDDDNEPPTRNNLLYLLENKLKEINLTENDRLVFYFAGHGTKRDSDTDPAGYLVPKDGDINNISTLLDMKTLIQHLADLPCRHLLLIFDCCFGGAIRWEIFRKGTTAPQNFYQEHYQQYTQAKAWQVITSSTYKEEALDSFRDTRGNQPGTNHSPFAYFLFQALENGLPTGNGVITATKLYVHLRDRVQESSKLKQTPQIFPLKNHESGEYIFELPSFNLEELKNAPELDPKNNPYRGLNAFDEEDAQFFFGREELKKKLCEKVSSSSSNLTIVLGDSGSGKSSLVKAGLIPCLREQEQTQQKWCILNPMRPGEAPFNELAITIASLTDVNFSIQELNELSFISQELQKKQAELQIHEQSKIKRLKEKYEKIIKISGVWNSDDHQAKSKILLENYQELYELLSGDNKKQTLRNIVFEHLTELHKNLKANPQYFIDIVNTWSQQHPQEHILLVIDQFEELITLNQNQQSKQKNKKQQGVGNEQEGFLNLLKKTLEANLSQLHIVLTLRSDFEPRFVTTDVFASYWKDARFQVRAMRTEELRQAIEQPATEMALEFDPQQPGLVDNLIDEVSQMPGALPLLSFTLSELYINLYKSNIGKTTSDRILKLEDNFAQQGGVIGSLTRKANEVYDQLDDKLHQATMRRVMLRMVTIEGGESARRRVPRSELNYSDLEENKWVEKVIDTLSEARLIVHGINSEGKPCVEPAHDALVKGWDQLQKWKEEDEQGLFLQKRLIPASNDWYEIAEDENTQNQKKLFQLPEVLWKLPVHFYGVAEALAIDKYQAFQRQRQRKKIQKSKKSQANGNTKSKAYLWNNDPRLVQLNQVIDSENDWLNKIEDDFVKQSSVEKGRTIFRWIIGVSGVVLILLGLTSFASWGYIESLKSQIRANRESAEANLRSGSDLEAMLDILRARQKLKQLLRFGLFQSEAELASVKGTMHKVLYQIKERNRLQTNRGSIYEIALSPDNKQLVTVGDEDKIFLWEIGKKEPVDAIRTGQTDVYTVAFSPDHQQIATGGSDGTVKLWDIKDGNITSSKSQPEGGIKTKQGTEDETVYSVVFLNKDKLATIGEGDKVKVWDISSGQMEAEVSTKQEYIDKLAFSSEKKLLAIAGRDNQVSLCKVSIGQNKVSLCEAPSNRPTGKSIVETVAFTRDHRLAIATEDGTIKLWDVKENNINPSKTAPKEIKTNQYIVYSMALLSDGKLATVGADDTVILQDSSGKQIQQIQPLERSIRNNSVALSPDGNLLATGGDDGIVRLWDSFGKPRGRFKIGQGTISSVEFSPDGTQLVTAGQENNTVKLWDISSGTEKQTISIGQKGIVSVVFNPQNPKDLGTIGVDGTFKIWNVSEESKDAQKKPISEIPTNLQEVKSAVFTPNGQVLITLSKDGKVQRWDNPQKPTNLLANFQVEIASLALSPDGKKIAIGGADGTVWEWDDTSKEPKLLLKTQQGSIDALAYTPDGKLATVGEDNTVRLWETSGYLPIEFPRQEDVHSMAFNSESKNLVTVEKNGTAKLWDSSGKLLKQIPVQKDVEYKVAFSADNKLAFAGNDGTVKLLDASGNQIAEEQTEQGAITSVMFSLDGKLLVTIGENTVKLWKVEEDGALTLKRGFDKTDLKNLLPDDEEVSSIAFNPENQLLVVAGDNGTVKVHNISNNKDDSFLVEQNKVSSMAFSHDGKLLATAGEDGSLRLGDTSGKSFDQIQTLQGKVTSIVFSRDRKLLATIGEKKDKTTLKLWQISENNRLRQFKEPQEDIYNVAFSPDAKLLATYGENNKVSLNKVVSLLQVGNEENLIGEICRLVRDYLDNGSNLEESDRHLCDGFNQLTPPTTPMTPQEAIAGDYYDRGQEESSENQIRKKPNNVDDYINKGVAYYRLRKKYPKQNYIQLAIDHYTKALEMSPRKDQAANALVNRGIAYSTRGDQESAIDDYDEVINNVDPNYVDAYISRGIAHSVIEDKDPQGFIENLDKAIGNYKTAIDITLKDNDPESKFKRANAYYAKGFTLALQEGKKQEAIEAYRRAEILYWRQGKESYRQSAAKRIEELK
ncbi:MAG: hypothetical protein C6Y22_22395 [Hapalosiphonaceae cyanobacterium JJU2]|nr:MAG: hypothetical protein C6Y22_22395 [Hapalosiphonaceae cyanobacterium JJU2]